MNSSPSAETPRIPVALLALAVAAVGWTLPCSRSVAATGNADATDPAVADAAVPAEADIVVYGGTAAGVMAAVQAARMGKSVVLIEPSDRLGGLTTGGLGQTDIGNKHVIGGLAREFYRRVRRHYANPEAWPWQKREDYRSMGQSRTDAGEDAMWTFEPGVALGLIEGFVREHGIPVVFGDRLDRRDGIGVRRSPGDGRIEEIVMESGRVFRGRIFIDATYEGDLMAGAAVRFTVGREANSVYGESLNGIQVAQATKHQFPPECRVDPWVVPGDPTSGLLPGIESGGPGTDGEADLRVQAYCFRMCLTDLPENRLPVERPDDHDPLLHELLLRYAESGHYHSPEAKYDLMPNRKTDTNNHGAVSTDWIGMNHDYPEASYAEREAIVAAHRSYQLGYLWTLQNDPRVPEPIRAWYLRWGLPRDEFEKYGNWTPQLYIREARRMVGELVMTQHHCQGRETADRPIGMAAYGMDSHNVRRYVDSEGFVRNEGDVQVGGFPPYPVGYGAILPLRGECGNLAVPVCLSASHIAFGSIRMEPVFMVLAQSAATAAALAIDADVPLHAVDYGSLRERLLADGQILTLPESGARRGGGVPRASLPGIVVDDADPSGASRTAGWVPSTVGHAGVHRGYLHDDDSRKGELHGDFSAAVPDAGRYSVKVAYVAHGNRAARVPVRVSVAGREAAASLAHVDMRKGREFETVLASVAELRLEAGDRVTVRISNAGTDGFVVLDAVQLLPIEAE